MALRAVVVGGGIGGALFGVGSSQMSSALNENVLVKMPPDHM